MLTLLLILNNVLPVGAVDGEKRCLQSDSGGKSSSTNIGQVAQQPHMLCGLNQETRDEAEGREDLLIVEPLSDQAGKARNVISISYLINSTRPVESQTQRTLELGRSSCSNIDQVKQ